MIFHLCILGVAFAATPSSRPILKKIEHLKTAAPAMINLYFVDAIPDGNNAAHAVGTLKNLSRRTRVAERLNNKMVSLAEVVGKAVEDDCVILTARGSIERFVSGDFKLAQRQILKNYLRLRDSIKTDTRFCAKMYNKITRKVERYDSNLRNKYCEKVYAEEWCGKEYEYSLDKRVEGTN